MRSVLLIVGKDLRERARDRSLLLFAVVVPLAIAFVYNLVLGKASDPDPFRYAVVDLDRGPVAAAFVEDVLGTLADDDVVTIRRVATAEAARSLTRAGDVDAAFVLPSGFSSGVSAAQPLELRHRRVAIDGDVRPGAGGYVQIVLQDRCPVVNRHQLKPDFRGVRAGALPGRRSR